MTAASSPSMQCSVNHAGIPSTATVDSTFPPAAFLLFLQQVILLLCGVTQTPTDQSPCTLFFSELVLLMEKSPCAISPIPKLIYSVLPRSLPTHSVCLYDAILSRSEGIFITTSQLLPSNIVPRLRSITIHGS